MANPAQTSLQVGNTQQGTVSRMPQTGTKSSADAPFVRLSRKSQTQGFVVSGLAYGGLVNQPLKAAGGYLRGLLLTITSSGGTGGSGVLAADAPWNVVATLLLRDPLGQPIIQTDGFGLFLINIYSGQCGEGQAADPSNRPSYDISGAANGNFTFKVFIPLELDSAAYCALSSLNAAAQPTINIQVAPQLTVLSTPPATLQPTLTVEVEQVFWAVPFQDSSLAPPDAGSSSQWSTAPGAQGIPSTGSPRVTAPRTGTWIHSLILVMRDNGNVRVDDFGDTVIFWVDGVPLLIEHTADRIDKMSEFTDGITRPTGVLAYTFRDAVKPIISLADTHDLLLPTTPATLLEVQPGGATIASAPATLTFITGELYPVNAQRIPYTHLAR